MTASNFVHDERGATVVEFAAVLPLMCIALLGGMDLVHREYAQSILTGNVQKVGRDSTLQGGAGAAAANDAKVKEAVLQVAPDATVTFDRTSFAQYRDVGGEAFTDKNNNGVRDAGKNGKPGECFDDSNGNGAWDADVSEDNQGGASDVVLYKVTVTYPRLFPVAKMLGFTADQTISAQTAMKNQPYASSYEVKTICP